MKTNAYRISGGKIWGTLVALGLAMAALPAAGQDAEAEGSDTPLELAAPLGDPQVNATGQEQDAVIPGTTPPNEAPRERERGRVVIAGLQSDAPAPTLRTPEPSVTQRLTMSPEDALRGTPFGDIVANDPDLERAILKRTGPMNREQMLRAMEIAAAIDNARPVQANAIRSDLIETQFAQQQEFYVTTRDPDVPSVGNVVPAAAVLVDATAEALE